MFCGFSLCHAVLIEAKPTTPPEDGGTVAEQKPSTTYLGAVSDRALLAYFANFALQSRPAVQSPSPMLHPHSPRLPASEQPSTLTSQPSQSPKPVSALTASRPTTSPKPQLPSSTFTFSTLLAYPLNLLSLPTLQVYASVVAATSSSTVLDAMRLMSECGVSSVAVVDDGGGGYGGGYGSWGGLNGAVSVTDIGKVRFFPCYRWTLELIGVSLPLCTSCAQLIVPSQSNHILSTPLHQFVAQIKEPDGIEDGVDRYPGSYSFPPFRTQSQQLFHMLRFLFGHFRLMLIGYSVCRPHHQHTLICDSETTCECVTFLSCRI